MLGNKGILSHMLRPQAGAGGGGLLDKFLSPTHLIMGKPDFSKGARKDREATGSLGERLPPPMHQINMRQKQRERMPEPGAGFLCDLCPSAFAVLAPPSCHPKAGVRPHFPCCV